MVCSTRKKQQLIKHQCLTCLILNGVSFSNTTTYPSTTFIGNKLFSYKQGTGTNDIELGFPLSYRALENTGDIEFDFNLFKHKSYLPTK